MSMLSLRRSVVVTVGLVGALPLLLLAVATAWLGSNLNDIAPRPRPAVLQLPQATLPDDRNAFFALVGLSAEAGRDAGTAGRALWKVEIARQTLLEKRPLDSVRLAELNQQDAAATGPRLPEVTRAPLHCKPAADGCVAEWLAEPSALAAQRQQMAMVGERCDAMGEPGMGFEERLPARPGPAMSSALHMQGALRCSRWWRSGAVLAWQQGRPQQTTALLGQATRMNSALLAGGQSLVSHLITAAISRETQATIVALGLRDPTLAGTLAPLLAPLPDEVQVAAARRWMAVEAVTVRNSFAEAFECLDPGETGRDQMLGWLASRVNHWQCRHHIGLQPQRTLALADDFWAANAQALGGGLPAAMQHVQARQQQAETTGWRWHNTIGNLLIDVAAPSYENYLRQAADLPLHTEAAALALAASAQRIPAAERAAWAQRQPMSAPLRERLHWDASGQGFTVRTWYEEGRTAPIEPRKAIRFAWPAEASG